MSAIGWHTHLDESSTQAQVVAVCNQFLLMWTREELAQLPAACRPKDSMAVEDVSPYALALVLQMDLAGGAAAPMLQRMSTFFTKAALRLAEIPPAPRRQPVYDDQLHTAFLPSNVTG